MRTKMKAEVSCIAGFAACFTGMCAAGLLYNPYTDPGAMTWAVAFFWAALLQLVILAVMAVVSVVRAWNREAARLGLTPLQKAIAEAAMMGAADWALREHNKAEQQRLTESVMGHPRDFQHPGWWAQ